MGAEARLVELGIELPPLPVAPPGVQIPFEWVRVVDDRVFASGHGALGPDGAPVGPFGRVPTEVSLTDAQASARQAGLALLSGVRHALGGDLDRVRAWLVVSAFVNAEPGYGQTTAVANPISALLLDVFGDAGRHARTAIGVAALPLNLPIVVSAELLVG